MLNKNIHLKMSDTKIQLTDKLIINHTGLSYIARYLNDKKTFSRINRIAEYKQDCAYISDYDIIKTMVALISLGYTDYDNIEEFRNNKYFKKVLNLKRVPSAPTLRQRMESYGEEMWNVFRQINIEIIGTSFKDETTTINNKEYLIIESDVTPMDNSGTKKEGIGKTYKQFVGYAPMMSYAGRSGFMVNNELRKGELHSNCPGTKEYFTETIELTRQLSPHPLLMIIDSGNDDGKLVLELKARGTEFIIKRNLRRESKEKYINYAIKNHEKKVIDVGTGCTTYYARWQRVVEGQSIPIAVVITEAIKDKKGQPFLMPQYDIEVYWNTLNMESEEVEKLYHKHGTSEQYHSEFKSDLDMERLPSGKFKANYTIMLLGMLSFNLLRITGKALLQTGKVPGRHRVRLRLRTVLLNIMYMAGQYIEHARHQVLQIWRGHRWSHGFALIM